MQAINAHNDALPPKKAKEALPEFYAANVYAKTMVKRDPKTGVMDYTAKHCHNGYADTEESELPQNSVHGHQLHNQMRGLQKQSSMIRIANLRKHFGGLIGTRENLNESAINPFQDGIKTSGSTMSLSVYNKPKSLGRPKTASNIFSSIKGLEAAGEEEIVAAEPTGDTRIADMENPMELTML